MMNYTVGTKVLIDTTCVTPCILCLQFVVLQVIPDGLLSKAIGSLRNDDGEGNKNSKKVKGLD